MEKFQIIIDILAVLTFGFIAVCERSFGYCMAAFWAFIALLAHVEITEYKKEK